jgi:hypothetical protein
VSETTEVKRFDGEILGFLMEQKNALSALRPQILNEGSADTIDELDGTIEQVTAAINTIALAQFARQEAREKYAKWRVILPQCRAAAEKSEALARDVEHAAFKLSEMRSRADDAFDKVLQARDKRPRPEKFPTDREIQEQNKREQKTEANHREHVARVREANDAHQRLIREQWEHKLILDGLLFQERQLRPREPQTERGVGELSAVR